MSVEEKKIEVFRRDTGSHAVKQMRADGFVPGNYYAGDVPEAIACKVELRELQDALNSEAKLYHISVGGKKRNVIIKEIQYHPVTDDILHVDFFGVNMDAKIEIRVPIHIEGVSPGVKNDGGQLVHPTTEVDIKCLASEIPSHITVDISQMEIGDTIHASDLELGDAELVTSPDTLIASVTRAREDALGAADKEEGFTFEDASGADGGGAAAGDHGTGDSGEEG